MTVASLHVSTSSPLAGSTDALVLGVSSSADGPRLHGSFPELASLTGQLQALGVTGTEDELRRLPSGLPGVRSIALIGLGSGDIDGNSLRRAAGAATRQLSGTDAVTIALPTATVEDVRAVLEGAAIGAYRFDRYRSSAPELAQRVPSRITVFSESEPPAGLVSAAATIAEAVHLVRDLVNTPALDLYPASFAERASELCKELPVSISVLAEDELSDGGFGGILGVGQGSSRGPRLVKVTYSPAGATRHIALVGKGITFDSGGLSLKPAASMVGMKYDMTGAATVLATALAVARLGLAVKVTAWLCLAENLPSATSIRPSDVLRIRNGKTVEVLNTDAEGRLVLADGLSAASEEQPDAIIDVATLTGSARVALGDRYVPTMGDAGLVSQLVEVAAGVGEPLWHMPLPGELRAMLQSEVADLTNVKMGSTAAGMLIAGVFLQEFVGSSPDGSRIPWAHLDIAGPAANDGGGYGYTGKGSTGIAVRSLVALAEQFSLS